MGLTLPATWRALSVDPGEHPGYVVLDGAGRLVAASHKEEAWALPPFEYELAVTEGQWIYGGSEVNPNTLFTLAFRAGWQLARLKAKRHLRLLPQVWRKNSSADKAQMQRRIARGLTVEERRLFAKIPKSRHGDVLDAIGIGRRGIELALQYPEADSPHEWPPVKARRTKK